MAFMIENIIASIVIRIKRIYIHHFSQNLCCCNFFHPNYPNCLLVKSFLSLLLLWLQVKLYSNNSVLMLARSHL